MQHRYSIIGGDIHKLIKISSTEDWNHYAWRIHHENDLYWVPIKNEKAQNRLGRWIWQSENIDCPLCLKKWYSDATKHL